MQMQMSFLLQNAAYVLDHDSRCAHQSLIVAHPEKYLYLVFPCNEFNGSKIAKGF